MKESQFFIEYLIVRAFAAATITFAVLVVFVPAVTISSDVSALQVAILALLLPTIGLAIDSMGKVLLWFVDRLARGLHILVGNSARHFRERATTPSRLTRLLSFVEASCKDESKPDISHAQMAKYGAEVIRQSEMRKSRERVARGGFASAVICALIFWIGVRDGADLRLHLILAALCALVFCGAWYRYRRRVRVHRRAILEAFADAAAGVSTQLIPIKAGESTTEAPMGCTASTVSSAEKPVTS